MSSVAQETSSRLCLCSVAFCLPKPIFSIYNVHQQYMHSKITYYWDSDDPIDIGKRLDEAFNRVISFCPELLVQVTKKTDRSPELIAFNRVVGGDFDIDDLLKLTDYADLVKSRIMEKYGESSGQVAESIRQAAENLVTVAHDALQYV